MRWPEIPGRVFAKGISVSTEKKDAVVYTYMGIDIGGTKIQVSLVEESGTVLSGHRCATPRDVGPEGVVAAIERAIDETLTEADLQSTDLAAIGLAVPGVVDPDRGLVVVTPNMNLTGVAIGSHIEDRFKIPVALSNDCNLGTLGETWLGSARNAKSTVGILVGTGVGSGVVNNGKLWRGARESAGEIGHIVMQIGGPKCGCGNHGCLEALASRSAIERDIRQAVADGQETVLSELLQGDLSMIRSGMLRRALEAEDELVTQVMRAASEVLGHACLTVRHLVDPEVIVLGGGVMEACSDFMLPIVENIVGSDQLPGAREGGRVLLSALGDDAVVLGAVALAATHVGRNPFKKSNAVGPRYPKLTGAGFGTITVGGKTHSRDICIRVNGKVKKRKKEVAREHYGSSHTIGPKELEKVCKGGPEIVFIGSGHSGKVELNEEGQRYLSQRSIDCQVAPTPEAVEAFNACEKRKAALIHVTC